MSRSSRIAAIPDTAAPTQADRIHLTGLTFQGRHGWYETERKLDRPFTVDLTVSADLAAASLSDDLEDTLDYNGLARTVERVVTGPSHRLIERLAGAIAEAVFDDHPVQIVELTVHKPSPNIAGQPARASVTIRRERT